MPRPKKQTRQAAGKWKELELYQHQQEAENAYLHGFLRMFLAWHRRAGKDIFALDFARKRMLERVGTYWHLFPFHVQAKRAIWKGIDNRDGVRFIDRAFPKVMRESENDTEMSITLTNGSMYQMLGSDNYDRMIGSNPCGIIFSEWALCDPAAWDYIRPILVENKGWAMFITTFRGRNHAWRMFENVKDADSWYADLRTIADTYRRDGKPIVSSADVEKEISEGMDPALAQQEFYCDPDAATSGAIFKRQHEKLRHILPCNHTPNNRVIRIAWGIQDEGIAAVAFQGRNIIQIHRFCESNLTDAVHAVARRHPHSPIIHHAIAPDPTLFSHLDGEGVVASRVSSDPAMLHGHAAALLNVCEPTSVAREALLDFSQGFAPYRNSHDETDLTYAALAQALAVANGAQFLARPTNRAPLKYNDRSVI